MKFISWNVNGLRAVLKKGFEAFVIEENPDFICIQETKMQEGQAVVDLPGYKQYYNSAVKKGYSGTAIFTKHEPIKVTNDMGIEVHDQEGRVIALEYEKFILVTVYTPNSKRDLERLEYRMQWEDDFANYLKDLEKVKPVIVCGDLNVAHQEIDLKNPQSNRKNAGFTDEERSKMTALLNRGFIDTFRYKYPLTEGAYTWWSYMNQARTRNIGWRIDYFLVSASLKKQIEDASIYAHILGSDHCPVGLSLRLD